ncbi:MAG: LLM class F420-dependent oxidoreductase [Deltaproteobacteria bacterium]|nr:LLM class F420-dependent oxidoreductase [Deltaproteobacteria bacterium]
MKIGVVFPQTEIGPDPIVVRDYAQTVEDLGFDHLTAYDHVLGATHDREPRLTGPYTEDSLFHEPLVLFGYLAAATSRIELTTGVLVLPQRQTALVAKQAAEVDVLSGGRLRLGVGVGWNYVEYEALNEDWTNRGKRQEEQIEVLRLLFSERVVDYRGEYHRIDRAGLLPLPERRIPIWLGGFVPAAYERAARLADGFIFGGRASDAAKELEQTRALVSKAGRSQDEFGAELIMMGLGVDDLQRLVDDARVWQEAGGTHVSLVTVECGLNTPKDHLSAVERFSRAIRDAGLDA